MPVIVFLAIAVIASGALSGSSDVVFMTKAEREAERKRLGPSEYEKAWNRFKHSLKFKDGE